MQTRQVLKMVILGIAAGVIMAYVMSLLQGCGSEDNKADMADTAPDITETVIPPGGEFVIGHHQPPDDSTLDPVDLGTFIPIEDGMRLPIILGGQGASMVVIGVRTREIFTPPLAIDIALEADGNPLSSLLLEQLSFTLSDGGYDYLLNMFVAFDGCTFFDAGTPGRLTVSLRDAAGHRLEETFEIELDQNDFCFGKLDRPRVLPDAGPSRRIARLL